MAEAFSEEVMTYKLLFDGEGTGDEKKFSQFLRQCKTWIDSTDTSPEYNEKMYDSLVRQVDPIALIFLKTRAAIEMNRRETALYEKELASIKTRTEAAKADIIAARKELEFAQILRERKAEYDALARVIDRHRDRETSEKELAALQAEIDKLLKTKRQYQDMKDEREKMCRNLIFAAQQVKKLLEEYHLAVVVPDEPRLDGSSSPEVVDLEGPALPPPPALPTTTSSSDVEMISSETTHSQPAAS